MSTSPDWQELDKRHVWHPFTPMGRWLAGENTIIESADGFELIDTRGRRYIDGFSSLWCNLHGHRVSQIDDAIRRQLDLVAHSTLLGFGSLPSIELAFRLAALPPKHWGLSRVFFSDSGASAVEVAIKLAYQYFHNVGQPQRRRFIALREAYHGDTLGAVSVGGIGMFHRMFGPLLFQATFVDTPNPFVNPAGGRAGEAVIAQIEQVLAIAPGEYAAVVIEPMIQAAAGMLTQPPGFMRALREVTARHGVLLIADEVATGFCRTGRMFACEHEDASPDLLCLGKGLTGGYLPVSATMASERVFSAFVAGQDEDAGDGRTFYHGHTFSGNALGCAAAVASIDLIHSSGLLAALPGKVGLIECKLSALRGHANVADIRQCGMMVGIELMADPAVRRPFDPALRTGAAVCDAARPRGVIIRPLGDIVVLMPAPAMDTATLERLLDAAVATIEECFR